jgi:phage tail-like protein
MEGAMVSAERFRHDPASLLLPGAAGWEGSVLERVVARGRLLRLARTQESAGIEFATPEASLGGLVPPAYAAVDAAGNVFVLDRGEPRLHVLDPCDCTLRPVPAFGGLGSGPRELDDPRAVAASRRNVYIADTGNRRVTVLDIGLFQLRAHLAPPDPTAWFPVDVAVGRAGRILVADSLGGRVHAFAATGRYVGAVVEGVAGIVRVASDGHGCIYVGIAGEHAVRLFSPTGEPRGPVAASEQVADRFRPLPFDVAPDGTIDLGPVAGNGSASSGRRCVLGPGLEILDAAPAAVTSYVTEGRFVSPRLDSRLPGCQWHRVVLTGRLPERARITVRSAASDVPVDAPEADDRRWSTPVQVRGAGAEKPRADAWDAIVLAPPGRYLWIELVLRADGTKTPELDGIEAEYPRLSLRRYLPAVFGEQPEARQFLDRFLAVFDTGFRSVERHLDGQAAWFDLRSAPAGEPDVLGWLASWIGLSADRNLPERRRRAVLIAARDALPRRGTVASLRRVLSSWVELDAAATACAPCPPRRCDPPRRPCGVAGLAERPWQQPLLILEHFRLRRWLFLGPSRIGDQAYLWGSSIINRTQLDVSAQADATQLIASQDPRRDLFHHYAHKFSVFVPARLVDEERSRRALSLLIREESPAHTRFQLEAVEPRFRIGVQSTIGFDAVVGRFPKRALVAASHTDPERSRLGRAVVGGRTPKGLVVGTARTGSTTRLE